MRFPHNLVLMQREYAHTGSAVQQDPDTGFPIEADAGETAFRGWLQPSPAVKRIKEGAETREALASDEAGLAFSSHLLFAPMGLPARKNDRIRKDPDDGLNYLVTHDPQDAAGRGHHLEIDLVEYRYAEADA